VKGRVLLDLRLLKLEAPPFVFSSKLPENVTFIFPSTKIPFSKSLLILPKFLILRKVYSKEEEPPYPVYAEELMRTMATHTMRGC
jgi:hypothetical protein